MMRLSDRSSCLEWMPDRFAPDPGAGDRPHGRVVLGASPRDGESRVELGRPGVRVAEQPLDGIERQARVPGERGPGCGMAKRLAPRRGAERLP